MPAPVNRAGEGGRVLETLSTPIYLLDLEVVCISSVFELELTSRLHLDFSFANWGSV